ncbi:ABC transporter permease subunit [Clostridium sp. D2Q-14]|uniref:ABC transporter permease subunit n=1 Tax=Anaeromonas gelatinilytica TaxID=2683194 RepID=UPI00193B48B0|nr:ABC transporter permease subunit [Anaeromonas gelatinilytica]MBS4534508.1 ABC transporter permease subunit [Anaeromonas gelatinilytica]
MITLISFEFKKFFSKKKNIIIILLLFLFTLLFILLNNNINSDKKESELFSLEEHIESFESSLEELENDYENFKDEKPTVANNIKKIIDDHEMQIDILKRKKQGLISGDWKESLKSDIEFDKYTLEGKKDGTIVGGEDSNIIEERLEVNKILLEKNIKPIDTETSVTAWNFMKLLVKNLVPLIIIVLILLFSSDAVSSEMDEGTFKISLLQPITRNKIILSKIISYSLICILILTVLFSAFFLGLGIIEGFGSSEYPTKYYNGSFTNYFGNNAEDGVEYIQIKKFILYIIPFLILLILAIVAISVFISTVVSNSLAAISISVIGYISFFIINSQLGMVSKIAHLVPTTYSNIPLLLNGEAIVIYSNNNITYINGIIVLLAIILIFNTSSIFMFRKKDIL